MQESKLGLGTVQFGLRYGISNSNGQTTAAEVTSILQLAAANHICVLDTASAYGNAEAVLGANDLASFRIVSKYITPSSGNTATRQLQQSMQQLNVKRLYGYLAHRPAEIISDTDQWKQLNEFQQKGWVEKIGFSLNTTAELDTLIAKGFIPQLIQVPYNYLDHRFERQMQQLKERGCEIHTRSAFLQGLFFKEEQSLPAFFDPVKPVIKRLKQQTNNLQGALLYHVASKPFIDKVIVGVENATQLQQNINDLSLCIETEPCSVNIPEQVIMPSNWPAA